MLKLHHCTAVCKTSWIVLDSSHGTHNSSMFHTFGFTTTYLSSIVMTVANECIYYLCIHLLFVPCYRGCFMLDLRGHSPTHLTSHISKMPSRVHQIMSSPQKNFPIQRYCRTGSCFWGSASSRVYVARNPCPFVGTWSCRCNRWQSVWVMKTGASTSVGGTRFSGGVLTFAVLDVRISGLQY